MDRFLQVILHSNATKFEGKERVGRKEQWEGERKKRKVEKMKGKGREEKRREGETMT